MISKYCSGWMALGVGWVMSVRVRDRSSHKWARWALDQFGVAQTNTPETARRTSAWGRRRFGYNNFTIFAERKCWKWRNRLAKTSCKTFVCVCVRANVFLFLAFLYVQLSSHRFSVHFCCGYYRWSFSKTSYSITSLFMYIERCFRWIRNSRIFQLLRELGLMFAVRNDDAVTSHPFCLRNMHFYA